MKFKEKDVLTLDGEKRYFVVRILNYGIDKVLFLLNLDNLKETAYMKLEKDNILTEIDNPVCIEELKELVIEDKEKNLKDIDVALAFLEELSN